MEEAGTETMAAALHLPSRSYIMVLLCPTLGKPCREENSESIAQLSSGETLQCHHHKGTEEKKAILEKSGNKFISLYILQGREAYREVNRNRKITIRKT